MYGTVFEVNFDKNSYNMNQSLFDPQGKGMKQNISKDHHLNNEYCFSRI